MRGKPKKYIIQILKKKKKLVQILCAEIEYIQWGVVGFIRLHNKQVIGALKNRNLGIKELIFLRNKYTETQFTEANNTINNFSC